MKAYFRTVVIMIFLGGGILMYVASAQGWGVKGLDDPTTRQEIQQNCPDDYRNSQGDCLKRTFRSYYLARGIRGGGFGSSGK
ncbi:MAG: hypothetical protein AAF824_24420 [Bacteroidota bacterium]